MSCAGFPLQLVLPTGASLGNIRIKRTAAGKPLLPRCRVYLEIPYTEKWHLYELFDSAAGLVKVGICFGKAKTHEPMTISAGEERFARYAGYTRLVE
jgi:hypothetical protein